MLVNHSLQGSVGSVSAPVGLLSGQHHERLLFQTLPLIRKVMLYQFGEHLTLPIVLKIPDEQS